MAITAGEQQTGGEVRDNDGRLIVVGPGGVAIGGGGGGSDPLSDGTPGGALPSKTLWVAGADGTVLRGITVNASGHQLVAVQNFPSTQAVSDGGGSLTVDGTVTANAGTGPWPVTDNGGTLSVDDGAGSLTVDGSVSVSNFPASQPVTGTFFQATQPVSGTVNIGTAPQVAVNNVETLTDNGGFTDGTSKLFPQGYIFDETAGTALTENDVAAARVDSKRAVVNVLEDATTRGRRAIVSATGGLLGDQGAPATQANAWFVRPRQIATYGALYRLAAATAGSLTLTFTPVANADKQLATIYHTATSTKTVRLRYVSVLLQSANAAVYEYELRRLSATTAPATGNPAITPGSFDSSDGAAEATCLAMPTTAGSYTAADSPLAPGFTLAQAAAASPTNVLGVAGQELVLFDARALSEEKLLTMRAGIAEGFAVIGRGNAASATFLKVFVEFTEE